MIKHPFMLFLLLATALAGCPKDDVSLGDDQPPSNGDGDSDGAADGTDGTDGGQAADGEGDGQEVDADAGAMDGSDAEPDEPCAGKQCGDTCSPCAPNDPQCAEAGLIYACNLDGRCVGATENMCVTGVSCTYQCGIQGCWSDGCAQGQQYCALTQGNEQCGGTGTCENLPSTGSCSAVVEPVCGCDGRSYGNDCEAGVAGVNVSHAGACN